MKTTGQSLDHKLSEEEYKKRRRYTWTRYLGWTDHIRKQQPEEYFSLKFETRSFVAFNTPDTMSYLEKDIGQQMYTGVSIEVHIWTGIGIFFFNFYNIDGLSVCSLSLSQGTQT